MAENHLSHISEFRKVLESYHVSDRAQGAIDNLKLVLMLAPTSTGRNTIIRHLISTGEYYYLVSDTTRKPRINDGVPERSGSEYWFRTEEEVLADLRAGEYLEAEIIHDQQVSGISIKEVEKAGAENKIAITDIDLVGLRNIMKVKRDAVPIMLLPPSFEEWQRRIARRGRMSKEEQRRRFQTAMKIFEDGLRQPYYRFVVADDIAHSAATIDAIVKNKPIPQQGRGEEILHQLHSRLKDYLEAEHWHS